MRAASPPRLAPHSGQVSVSAARAAPQQQEERAVAAAAAAAELGEVVVSDQGQAQSELAPAHQAVPSAAAVDHAAICTRVLQASPSVVPETTAAGRKAAVAAAAAVAARAAKVVA